MIHLLQSFNKLCSNLHHNRHKSKPSFPLSHLQAFESQLSSSLDRILLSISHSETLSFQWLLQLLQTLPIMHQAFAKLVVDLDCKLGADLADGYLNYTLNLLHLLNSITFSLTQLGKSRISLAYALSLVSSSNSMAVSRLKPIAQMRNYRGLENRGILSDRKQSRSGEEWAIEKALSTMEGIGYWVCGVVISGCEGDSTAYLEMRELAAGVAVPAFRALDSVLFEVVSGKGSVPEEVKEVNGAAAKVVGGGGGDGEAAEEMRRRLERLEKALEELGKEVDGRFSEVLDGRSRLLDVFRHSKTLN